MRFHEIASQHSTGNKGEKTEHKYRILVYLEIKKAVFLEREELGYFVLRNKQ
jgi:hypothetical protein